MRTVLLAACLGLGLALAGGASAGKVGFLKTFLYDPDGTGLVSAEWTKEGLVLDNRGATGVVASGGVIKGVAGKPLESLSFEVKDGAYCGAGSPRFSVRFENETGFRFFTCLYGMRSLGSEPGWTRVTFSDETPYCDGATASPSGCFGSGAIADLFLVHDEGPAKAVLDRIEVNGVVVSKYPS